MAGQEVGKSSEVTYSSHVARYEFRFTSLISPSTIPIFSSTFQANNHRLPSRLVLKKSYIMLTWLNYLSSSNLNPRDCKRPKIGILPAKKHLYTLTKAPMAHKTNSKEQFWYVFYNYKCSFVSPVLESSVPHTLYSGAYALLLAKSNFPFFETNILFLKYYKLRYPVYSPQFFTQLLSN